MTRLDNTVLFAWQVCEDGNHKRLLLSTFMMLGLLVGSPIGGRLGDQFGRKPTLLGAIVRFKNYNGKITFHRLFVLTKVNLLIVK